MRTLTLVLLVGTVGAAITALHERPPPPTVTAADNVAPTNADATTTPAKAPPSTTPPRAPERTVASVPPFGLVPGDPPATGPAEVDVEPDVPDQLDRCPDGRIAGDDDDGCPDPLVDGERVTIELPRIAPEERDAVITVARRPSRTIDDATVRPEWVY